MYEPPIKLIMGKMQTQLEENCMKTVQSYGFDVDKNELAKTLDYDRNQYEKGYADGRYDAVVHGHWIAKMIPTGVSAFGVDELTCEEEECSVCHKLFWVGEKKNFCPNCGADMRR